MQPPARPVEIKALSGARALPPLILVLYHYCEGHGYRGATWFDDPVGKGYLWVEFFFALSGFILIHVYGARAREFWRGHDYVPFLKARLSRLYPLHLFMLFAILFLMWTQNWLADLGGYVSFYNQPYHPMNTWPSFVANLFLVQAWNLFPWLTWNGASWFVSVEFALCLMFPIYAIISRAPWPAGFAVIGAGIAGLLALLSPRHGLDITFHDGVFRGMSGFAIGVGMAMLYRGAKESGRAPLPEWVHSLAQLCVLGYLYWATYHTGWSHGLRDIWFAIAMYLLIFTLAFDRGFLARAMSVGPMLKLGEWSYAIYMGQTFWLQAIHYFEQRVYPPDNTIVFGMRFHDFIFWLEPFTLLAVCIVWGALLAIYVEHPANAYLRRFFSVRKAKHA